MRRAKTKVWSTLSPPFHCQYTRNGSFGSRSKRRCRAVEYLPDLCSAKQGESSTYSYTSDEVNSATQPIEHYPLMPLLPITANDDI